MEISILREISRNNNDFIHDLSKKINIKLANNPYLIIKGDAGNGKSHLLGDIAKTRIDGNLPTLLLLPKCPCCKTGNLRCIAVFNQRGPT